ncbi:uncharacterized protein LOC143249911 [Tachypleus tridentatus]|uniref:uncharacterized protein LOC143249911 n=1 Tax=Tachypleus tridentatus TaxID=6853 RepID=UPI003FD41DB3
MLSKKILTVLFVASCLVASLDAVADPSLDQLQHFENRQISSPDIAATARLGGLDSLLNTGSLGALLTGLQPLLTALVPILIIFSLGSLLFPLFSVGVFRENFGRVLNDVNPLLKNSITNVFEKVSRALENAERKYN